MKWLMIPALIVTAAACSPTADKLVIPPRVEKVDNGGDASEIIFNSKVDILFVVDNSGSMSTHQHNLAANVQHFIDAFQNNGSLDYHIGVITTDMYSQQSGGGRLIGSTRFVSRNTPMGLNILAHNLLVGIDGSAFEMSFDPVAAALSPTMAQGWNSGFYRDDAYLAIVFITDAEDQSTSHSSDVLYRSLLNMKANNGDKILAYGVIVPSIDTFACERDEYTYPTRLESFLGMVSNGSGGKNVFNLCDPHFGKRLAEIGQDLADKVGNTIYLTRPPILETIEVWYGTMQIPPHPKKGWMYDPARNAIVLGREVEWQQQPPGTQVRVVFEPTSYPTQ